MADRLDIDFEDELDILNEDDQSEEQYQQTEAEGFEVIDPEGRSMSHGRPQQMRSLENDLNPAWNTGIAENTASNAAVFFAQYFDAEQQSSIRETQNEQHIHDNQVTRISRIGKEKRASLDKEIEYEKSIMDDLSRPEPERKSARMHYEQLVKEKMLSFDAETEEQKQESERTREIHKKQSKHQHKRRRKAVMRGVIALTAVGFVFAAVSKRR